MLHFQEQEIGTSPGGYDHQERMSLVGGLLSSAG